MPITRLSAKETLEKLRNISDDDSDGENENQDAYLDNDVEVSEDEYVVSSDEVDFTSDDGNDDDGCEDDEAVEGSNSNLFSKDGTVWSQLRQNQYTRIRHRISFYEKTGPSHYAMRNIDSTALSAFYCIFDFSMIRMVTHFTNLEAKKQSNQILVYRFMVSKYDKYYSIIKK